jgi:hypothetical protein
MNYEISQIANLENKNVGVPLWLLQHAVASVIADEWQDNESLLAAIDEGFDYAAAAHSVNGALSDAGSEYSVEAQDMQEALMIWAKRMNDK